MSRIKILKGIIKRRGVFMAGAVLIAAPFVLLWVGIAVVLWHTSQWMLDVSGGRP